MPCGDGRDVPPTPGVTGIGSCAGSRFSSVKPGEGGRAAHSDAKLTFYKGAECCGKAESHSQRVDFSFSIKRCLRIYIPKLGFFIVRYLGLLFSQRCQMLPTRQLIC